jgi:hypothetical protein
MSQEEIQDLISKVEVGMYSFLTFWIFVCHVA